MGIMQSVMPWWTCKSQIVRYFGSWLVYDDLTDVIGYLPSSPITVGT